MKFIKVTIALVALSCANLAAARTRGVEGGNENQKQRALSPSGKGKEKCFEDCKDSLTYYKRDNYPDFRPFSYAIENTPPGCILAPVRNDADIREIRSAISSTTVPSDSWIGIGKTIDDIQDDTSGNRRYEDWFNLDGTPVPATSTIWRSADPAQPNGSITGPNYQTRAVFNVLAGTGGGLADASPETANYVSGAIYKCCFDPCNVGASV